MPRYRDQPRAKRKATPGRGVLAPGFKPVRKGGKIVPKRTAPKRKSPIFGALPKPKQQVPGATKVRPRGTRNPKVSRTGQLSVTPAKKGTEAYRRAQRRKDSLYGTTRKLLERNERQQEALIRAVTGKKTQVELRRTFEGETKRLVGNAQVRADNRRKGGVVASQQQEIDRQRKAVKKAQEQLRTQQFYNDKANPAKGKTFLRRNPNAAVRTDTVVSKSRSLRDVSPARGDVRIIDPEKLPARGVPLAARREVRDNTKIVKSRTAPLKSQYRAQNRLKELGELPGKSDRQKSAERELARRKQDARTQALVRRTGGLSQVRGGNRRVKAGPAGQAPNFGKAARDVVRIAESNAKVVIGLDPRRVGAKVGRAAAPSVGGLVKKAVNYRKRDPLGIGVAKKAVSSREVRGAAKAVGTLAAATQPAGLMYLANPKNLEKQGKDVKRVIRKAQRGQTLTAAEIARASVAGGPEIAEALKKLPGGAGNVAKTPVLAADVFFEKPGKQFDKLVKDVADIVKSIPAGVKSFADDPVRMVNNTIDDYERRYGPLAKGDVAEFKKRLRKEGIAPELLDTFTVVSVGGTAAGRTLGVAARKGILGKRAKSIATERPKLVFGGGEARTQRVSKNFFRAGAQRAVDTARRKKLTRDQAKLDRRLEDEKAGRYTKSFEEPPVSPRARQAIDFNKGGADLPDEVVTPLLRPGAKTTLDVPVKLNAALKDWAKGRKGKSAGERDLIKAIDEMPVGKTGELRLSLPGTKAYSRLVIGKVDSTPEIRAAARNIDTNLFPAAQARKLAGMEVPDSAVPTLFDNRLIGAGRNLRKQVANIGSRAFVRMKVDQQQVRKVLNKELAAMNARERQAVYASIRYGITTPEQALKWLPERRRQIVNNRREYEKQNNKPFWGTYDELEVIDELLGDVQRAFTPKVAEAQDVFRRTTRKVGRENPALTGAQMVEREYGPMARLLGIKREDFQPEKVDVNEFRRADGTYDSAGYAKAIERANRRATRAFQRAVDRRRNEEGLARPGYFRDEKRPKDVYNQFTPGGSQAIAPDRKTKYVLEDMGRANTDAEVFVRGVMMNIKRAHNWNKVADVYDAVTLPGYRNMTLSQIQDAVEQGRLDLTKIAFWNPRRFRRRLDDIEAQLDAERSRFQRGKLTDNRPIPGDLSMDPDAKRLSNEVGVGMVDRVDEALGFTRTWDGMDRRTTYDPQAPVRTFDSLEDFQRFLDDLDGQANLFDKSGWSVVPASAHKEIMASTNPSNAAARIWDIAKGKTSRILLANPVWLQFQMASNAFLTGLSGSGALSWYKATKWWYKLSPEEKRAISPYIGVHKWYDDQTHLGSQGSKVPFVRGVINAWRNLKATPFWDRGLKNLNPLDALFKLDNAQNNFFRRVVFYNEVKRAAYRDMGANAGKAMRAQQQIIDIFKLSQPDDQMRAIINNKRLLEEHAQAVDDFLGNWLSYTNFERRYIGRAVMFYGFLRFSTKLTFYTMPVNHPITTSILLKMGQMQKEEVKRIFGDDVPVPSWEIGNWFSQDGKRRMEIARLNPFFNVYGPLLGNRGEVSIGRWDPANLLPLLPPMVVALSYDQLSKTEGGFAGERPWTVNGGTAYVRDQENEKGQRVGVRAQDRFQILLGKYLRMSPLYRELESAGIPGVIEPLRGGQTSDSNLIFRNPKKYKQEDDIKLNKEKIQRQTDNALSNFLQGLVSPIIQGDAEQVIEGARQYANQGKKKVKRKSQARDIKKSKRPSFGGGGSGPSFK